MTADVITSEAPDSPTPTWIKESITSGSLKQVDLETGTNGWASPPGNLFNLRSKSFFSAGQNKLSPSGESLLSPAAVDWLKSTSKLDNVLSRPDYRVVNSLRRQHESRGNDKFKSPSPFIFAVNLQFPGRDHHHSLILYFASPDPIDDKTDDNKFNLLRKFINGDDEFRNERFKLVNRMVNAPWIVKKLFGGFDGGGGCLIGKGLKVEYYRGEGWFEVDVDAGSSAFAAAVLRVALGCVTSVVMDLGFVVEAVTEEELPEMLIGAVRVCQMELSSAMLVDPDSG